MRTRTALRQFLLSTYPSAKVSSEVRIHEAFCLLLLKELHDNKHARDQQSTAAIAQRAAPIRDTGLGAHGLSVGYPPRGAVPVGKSYALCLR